jgi:hypothetical protein
MPPIKLKEIAQVTWLRGGGGPSKSGVCYYMCNYVEGRSGPWNKPETFAKAVEAARNFGAAAAMMNYAKALSLRHAPQQPPPAPGGQPRSYQPVTQTLVANHIYRAELWVGDLAQAAGAPNHELLIVTGPGPSDVIYFEPNFGFYQAQPPPSYNNRQLLEYEIDQKYRSLASQPLTARNFRYCRVRGIHEELPKGFI